MASRSGIWRDEAQFLWVVRMPSLRAMVEFLWLHESHPPLLYVLMRAWLGIFGDSERAALALPIGLGTALVPLAYLVGARAFSRRTGLIAAVLAATSPMLAWHSALVRPYSLMPLLCLASVSLLRHSLSAGGFRSWFAYIAVTLAMLLTHNWAFLVLGGQWVMVGIWFGRRGGRSPGPRMREWLLVQVALLVGYAPWIPVFLHQSRHAGLGPCSVVPRSALRLFVETMTSLTWPAATGLLALIGMSVWRATGRAATSSPEDRGRRLACFLFIGIPLVAFGAAILLSTKNLLVVQRCLVTVAPCVLIIIAHGIASLPLPGQPLSSLVATGVLTVLCLVSSTVLLSPIKSNAREMAAAVAAQAQPGDLILVTPAWLASSFNYYYQPDNPQVDYPFQDHVGAIDFDNLLDRLRDPEPVARVRRRLARAHRERRRVWLVMDRDRVLDEVPDGDRLPEEPGLDASGPVYMVRSNQLRKYLNGLYATPDSEAVPLDDRRGVEMLRVFLYDNRRGSCDNSSHPGS